MIRKISDCQLEIDEERGVAYVHNNRGITILRVCQIPLAAARQMQIDVVYDRELAKGIEGGGDDV